MVSFAYIMCLVLYKITQDCCLDIDAVKDASIGQGLPASKQALPNQHHAACIACCCAALSACQRAAHGMRLELCLELCIACCCAALSAFGRVFCDIPVCCAPFLLRFHEMMQGLRRSIPGEKACSMATALACHVDFSTDLFILPVLALCETLLPSFF